MRKLFNNNQKFSYVIEYIIGIALALCLFIGGFGFAGYMIAFCIGGEIAIEMCSWIYNNFYGFLIRLSTATTLLAFILLYVRGECKWINPINYWIKNNKI